MGNLPRTFQTRNWLRSSQQPAQTAPQPPHLRRRLAARTRTRELAPSCGDTYASIKRARRSRKLGTHEPGCAIDFFVAEETLISLSLGGAASAAIAASGGLEVKQLVA
jgi:hypothetical protein